MHLLDHRFPADYGRISPLFSIILSVTVTYLLTYLLAFFLTLYLALPVFYLSSDISSNCFSVPHFLILSGTGGDKLITSCWQVVGWWQVAEKLLTSWWQVDNELLTSRGQVDGKLMTSCWQVVGKLGKLTSSCQIDAKLRCIIKRCSNWYWAGINVC